MALQITDQSFDALLKENEVVVVDFWATWCGPCQMVGPIIEELAADYEGRAAIGKCDVDANSELPAQFGVRNIPTILLGNKKGCRRKYLATAFLYLGVLNLKELSLELLRT